MPATLVKTSNWVINLLTSFFKMKRVPPWLTLSGFLLLNIQWWCTTRYFQLKSNKINTEALFFIRYASKMHLNFLKMLYAVGATPERFIYSLNQYKKQPSLFVAWLFYFDIPYSDTLC